MNRQNLLLQEADHRIKNSLAIVAAQLKLQRARISDVEATAALDASVTRIMAVADIHRALQASERSGAVPIASTLKELCVQVGRMRPELDLSCVADDDILIDVSQAVPLNLAVSELLLNALKHAYLPGDPGHIAVSGRLADGTLLVTVSDEGAGMDATAPSERKFGQIMVDSFCAQLGATLEIEMAPGRGTVASIRVPLQPGNAPEIASAAAQAGRPTDGYSARFRAKDAIMQQTAIRTDTTETSLFDPVRLGPLTLANRIVMAPLKRSRASTDGVPSPLAAEYYAQRASAGLLIAEATNISPQGRGYAWTPGIYSDAQVQAWGLVTTAVHGHCGRIFDQLWHVGRISHPDLQPGHALPVAPSAIAARGQTYTEDGFRSFVVPRASSSATAPTDAPTDTAAAGRTGCASCWRWSRPWPPCGAAQKSAYACPRSPRSGRRAEEDFRRASPVLASSHPPSCRPANEQRAASSWLWWAYCALWRLEPCPD